MDQKIDNQALNDYLTLKKKREEAFLRFHLSKPEKEKEMFKHTLESLDRKLLDIECKFNTLGLKFVFPHEKQVEELTQQLSSLSDEEIEKAIHSKEGEIYSAIKTRWQFFTQYFKNRDTIAKINLLIQRLGYDNCIRLVGALRIGSLPEPIDLSLFSQDDRLWAMRLFQRLGFTVSLEDTILTENGASATQQCVRYKGEPIWLPPEDAQRFEKNQEELEGVSKKIQSYSAQKQAGMLKAEQEQTFENTQLRYLELLKEQDGLLQLFYKEEKLFF